MKIVDRHTLMEMPAGMVYLAGIEWDFRHLCVKGETMCDGAGKGFD